MIYGKDNGTLRLKKSKVCLQTKFVVVLTKLWVKNLKRKIVDDMSYNSFLD